MESKDVYSGEVKKRQVGDFLFVVESNEYCQPDLA